MRVGAVLLIVLSVVSCLSSPLVAQQSTTPFTSLERDRAIQMLQTIAGDVRKHYYDPKFHGIDWDARVREAKEKIEKSTSQNAALSHVAGALAALDDSHTFFLPPSRPYVHDYGIQFEMFGDHCFVIRVRPGSDAAAKGIKPGDEVLSINGITPSRDNMWQIDYVFHTLRPVLTLTLNLKSPDENQRQVEAAAKFRELLRLRDLSGSGGDNIWEIFRASEDARHRQRIRFAEVGDDLLIVKFPIFNASETEIGSLVAKARRYHGVVLDMRENPGGLVDTVKYLLQGMFDHEIKVPDRVGRKDTKPMIEHFHPHNPYTGQLLVLIDSKSASGAEIFARMVQLEKRGSVLGDHSSGSVMESLHYGYQAGMGVTVFYGASITEADVIMSDGKSLEHAGVMPDELVLPTGVDLANGRDPVLARAAQLLGTKLVPEDAGKLFPYEWPPEK